MNTHIKRAMTGLGAAALVFAFAGSAQAHNCTSGHTDTKANTEKAEKKATLVDIAASNEDFSTLVAAVRAAGLVETLQGEGPFTVFAPTNAAFAKLPEGTVDNLLKPENRKQLISILTYHVVPGRVMAEDVVKLEEAKTVQGSDVAISVSKEKGVSINDAMVVATDIEASNGIIHVIDNVILPPAEDPGE